MTSKWRFHYRDSYVTGFTVTRQLRATYRDWQKTRHRDVDGNSLNRRAVSVHAQKNGNHRKHDNFLPVPGLITSFRLKQQVLPEI
jgi:hypothetical protein